MNLRELLFNKTTETRTENYAKAFSTTKSAVLDLFGIGGAGRNLPEEIVYQKISQAIAEDLELGIRALLFLSDIRGGQGERRLFKIGLKVLIDTQPEALVKKVLELTPFFTRWDYMLDEYVMDSKYKNYVLELIKEEHEKGKPSLMHKWLPSIQRNSSLAKTIAKTLKMNNKEYRQYLSKNRKELRIVEKDMSANKWTEIDYSKLPSKASLIYRNAFLRHDKERYEEFINKVITGEKKINAKTLYPHEIVHKVWNGPDATMEALWKNLPNYVKDENKNILPLIDTSSSMKMQISKDSTVQALHVSIAMGIYLAERLKGEFKDSFLTFSRQPMLVKLTGTSLYQKIVNIEKRHWSFNTNIIAAFELILDVATRNNLNQKELPETIIIFSDMEFDASVDIDETPFKNIKRKYDEHNYKLPQIIFWNLNGRNVQFPVRQHEKGAILVSGYSPTTLQYILSGELKTPYELMVEVLMQDRYNVFD